MMFLGILSLLMVIIFNLYFIIIKILIKIKIPRMYIQYTKMYMFYYRMVFTPSMIFVGLLSLIFKDLMLTAFTILCFLIILLKIIVTGMSAYLGYLTIRKFLYHHHNIFYMTPEELELTIESDFLIESTKKWYQFWKK